ncbi:MAG: aspartate/glutamate racemase family protein [Desulfobacterales bacterium]|nr:MAG: aspartate/glutamate racemase family protein [Desulfobacterales bacterium]
MLYKIKKGQVSYGEAIGIILLENYAPFIPGDVANATTYNYPVRFQRVPGFTPQRIFSHDLTLLDAVCEAGRELVKEGVRAITGDCGFMVIYQDELAHKLAVPVFMSSLLQIPFMARLIGQDEKIGIITANAAALDDFVLGKAGVDNPANLRIRGLENSKNFADAAIAEVGYLDSVKVEQEVVSLAREMVEADPKVRVILLECSLLPPYGAAVQEAVDLPVFDFVTMIDYVFSAVVKKRFKGFM